MFKGLLKKIPWSITGANEVAMCPWCGSAAYVELVFVPYDEYERLKQIEAEVRELAYDELTINQVSYDYLRKRVREIVSVVLDRD